MIVEFHPKLNKILEKFKNSQKVKKKDFIIQEGIHKYLDDLPIYTDIRKGKHENSLLEVSIEIKNKKGIWEIFDENFIEKILNLKKSEVIFFVDNLFEELVQANFIGIICDEDLELKVNLLVLIKNFIFIKK